METYKKEQFVEAGIDKEFVQDNESSSTKGVLRGLHFQKNHTQGKLVRVTHGEVYDVAVDVRPGSETFGQWVGVTLSSDKKNMFYIPEGFAHGFLVLPDTAEFVYKCTDVYDPSSEGGIPWNDPSIAVEWPEIDASYKHLRRMKSMSLLLLKTSHGRENGFDDGDEEDQPESNSLNPNPRASQ